MDLNVLYERKPTSLVKAVRQGDLEAVKDLLESGTAHPNSADHRGWTALHEASALNRYVQRCKTITLPCCNSITNSVRCCHFNVCVQFSG